MKKTKRPTAAKTRSTRPRRQTPARKPARPKRRIPVAPKPTQSGPIPAILLEGDDWPWAIPAENPVPQAAEIEAPVVTDPPSLSSVSLQLASDVSEDSDPPAPAASPSDVSALAPVDALPPSPAPEPLRIEVAPELGSTLWLAAVEPRKLHASWTLDPVGSKQAEVSAIFLHVWRFSPGTEFDTLVEVSGSASHQFIEVPFADSDYRAELGCFEASGIWRPMALSDPVRTFRSPVQEDPPSELERLAAPGLPDSSSPCTETVVPPSEPPALPHPRSQDPFENPITTDGDAATPQPSSFPSSGTIGNAVHQHASSPSPSSLSLQEESSPESPRSFWFRTEVELVVYGATEPGASLDLAGMHIPLRPDGTFTARLAFPDGQHHLPVRATSPDGKDTRLIQFELQRQTR